MKNIILADDDTDKGHTEKCLSWDQLCQNPVPNFKPAQVDADDVATFPQFMFANGDVSSAFLLVFTHSIILVYIGSGGAFSGSLVNSFVEPLLSIEWRSLFDASGPI